MAVSQITPPLSRKTLIWLDKALATTKLKHGAYEIPIYFNSTRINTIIISLTIRLIKGSEAQLTVMY